MQYGYEKMMEEYELSYSELPQDAKYGIQAIKNIEKSMLMVEAKGQEVSNATINKVKANDKWVMNEILDYVHDTDDNDDDMPYEKEEIIDELETKTVVIPPHHLRIEDELKTLYSTGKKRYSIEELGDAAPSVYNALFDVYDPEEENGIETSYYSLIEKDDNLFHLSKI
jgi:hypothetical protein